MLIRYFLKCLILPPFSQILFILAGLVLYRWFPRLAKFSIALGLASLFFLSLPLTSNFLHKGLEKTPHLGIKELANLDAEAIVILTGDQNDHTPEFSVPVSSKDALTRIRYGAYLHRKTGLPILVSGGDVYGDNIRSLAETMAYELKEIFAVNVQWQEKQSRTTYENAKYSFEILEKEGIKKIVLLSSAYHIPRAILLFERVGFEVTPAPTFFLSRKPINVRSFLPSAAALANSAKAIHEWLGYFYYKAH